MKLSDYEPLPNRPNPQAEQARAALREYSAALLQNPPAQIIRSERIACIDISPYIDIVKQFAKNAEIGGRSNIRTSVERSDKLSIDQYIGQAGEAALPLYLTGSIDLYVKTRKQKDTKKTIGDDGCDLIGIRVDVKTSRANNGLDFDYHLYVRDREYHKNTAYVLGLIEPAALDYVHLVGWMSSDRLPKPNGDRREIKKSKLDSMDSLMRYLGMTLLQNPPAPLPLYPLEAPAPVVFEYRYDDGVQLWTDDPASIGAGAEGAER